MRTPKYIESDQGLREWVEKIAHEPLVAIDTESDSFHSYREKVCLIQMTVRQTDAVIDPLALTDLQPLAPLLANPDVTKVFHDACYDLACLRRDFGFEVRGIFDTMLASRLLGWRKFGLAAILQERYGHAVDKRFQRSDWGRRPLTAEQLDYARTDTHFLPRLYAELKAELEAAGRLSWLEEDCARLPETCSGLMPRREGPDPEGFWRIKGVRQLSAPVKGRLSALHLAREQIASRLDRPAFKVLSDAVLIDLARDPPASRQALQPRRGLRHGAIERFGKEIMAALRVAKPVTHDPPPRASKRRRTGRMLDAGGRQLYEALRAVRRVKAEEIGLEPEVGLGNAVLEDLARRPPKTMGSLRRRRELAGWRQDVFCEALFAAISEHAAGSGGGRSAELGDDGCSRDPSDG